MTRANLLDDLVGVGEQWRRNFDAERLFGLPAILYPAIESLGLRSNLSQRLLGSVAEFGADKREHIMRRTIWVTAAAIVAFCAMDSNTNAQRGSAQQAVTA